MIRLRVLGAPDLRGAEGHELRGILSQPRRLALLAYLALSASRGYVRRDTLLALFWPDADDAHARNSLRQALHHLRQILGEDVVIGRGADELGCAPDRLWCDVTAMEEALAAGDPVAALELYRGPLLPGFYVTDAPGFERWVEEERTRLRDRAAEAAWSLSDRERAAGPGHAAGAVHWARWAAGLTPDDEESLRRLLTLLIQMGDGAGAVRTYEQFATRLLQDLGITPSDETERIVAPLRAPKPPAGPPAEIRSLPPLPVPVLAPVPATALLAPVPPARTRNRRWLVPAATLFVVLGLAAAFLLKSRAPSPPVPAERAIVVFPFRIHGHPELAYLHDGIVDLLSARLDGAGGLRTIDPRAVLAAARADSNAATDPRLAAAVAARLGARFYVQGDIVEVAGRLQITTALFDASRGSRPVMQPAVEGDAPRILELADQLAARLLAGSSGGADTAFTRQAQVSTRSLPAFRSYLDGERAFRAGEYGRAVDAFQRAITQDTGFALAYYRLAVANDWAGSTTAVRDAAAQALRHADRLDPLSRRLLGGFVSYANRDIDAAEIDYRWIAGNRPDNVEAASMLGEVRFHFNPPRGRPFTEARADFEHVLALEPGDGPALVHLARIAAAEGGRIELDSLVRRYLVLNPDADRASEMRALRAYSLDDKAEQRRIAQEMERSSDVDLEVVTQGIAIFDQNLVGALRVSDAYFAPGRQAGFTTRGREWRARIESARGRWQGARAELHALATSEPDLSLVLWAQFAVSRFATSSPAELRALLDEVRRWVPSTGPSPMYVGRELAAVQPQIKAYLTGMVSLRLGNADGARAAVTELEQLGQNRGDSGVSRDLSHVIRAQLARQRNDDAAALGEIIQFRFLPGTRTGRLLYYVAADARFLRAELLRSLGRPAEAKVWYSSFPDPAFTDLVYLAPAHRRLGELAAQAGRRVEALDHYNRFLELWRDCDPELRSTLDTVRAAVVRLAGLTDSTRPR
jgi:DNA-binding SARP family transcriptional activator/TolB-like protein